MWKWAGRILFVAVIAWCGLAAYDYYRKGYHTRPDMPPGAFSISYKNGLRAILVDLPNEQGSRRYFGFPYEVPFFLEEVWSFCTPPSDEEAVQLADVIESRDWPGERVEAVCKIEVDKEIVVRGYITTVPKL